jgi:hypothetical protein
LNINNLGLDFKANLINSVCNGGREACNGYFRLIAIIILVISP